jgi:hypothetical protein
MRYGHETVKFWQIIITYLFPELKEAEPVDGSFLDVSLVEEVNSNSQENYCCGVCNKVFRRKAHLVRHSSP